MKVIKWIGVLLLIVQTVTAQNTNGIHFQQNLNWQEVLNKARQENKLIFVDAYTTWCAPCKQMDKDVYTTSEAGNLMNDRFISIKLQMDKTGSDSPFVQKWHKDAELINQQYKIEIYPSYLFFSSTGQLIYRDAGYKRPELFFQLATFAADAARNEFRSKLLAYKNGQKKYAELPDLSITARNLLGDHALALTISRDYTENYLYKLDDKELFTKEHIEFINQNGGIDLVHSSDRFFCTSYYNPALIDSLSGITGLADQYVKAVISREENILVNPNPDWMLIANNIHLKHPELAIESFILNEKINYYEHRENWDLYTLYKSEQIEQYPPTQEGMNIFFELNAPAWKVFQQSDNKEALYRALRWSEMSIALAPRDQHVQYLDTKANLLYKLGLIDKAICIEEQAIHLEDSISTEAGRAKGTGFVPEFINTLEKMKKREPTWPVK